MIRTKSSTFWLFCLMLTSCIMGQAQLKRIYEGPYELGNYRGQARFDYVIVGADSILDGSFQLKRSSLEALLAESDTSFSFVGEFVEGIPNGRWNFQFGNFDTDSTSSVSGYQYRVNINGVQQEAVGEVVSGKPNGKWRLSRKEILRSQVVDTLFFSEINFDEGIPQRSIRIRDSKNALVGRFLRNGFAHDTWSLYSDTDGTIENWYFNEGRLERMENIVNGTMESIPVFDDAMPNSTERNLDEGFVWLAHIYGGLEKGQSPIQSGISALLLENAQGYQRIDSIFTNLGSLRFQAQFKVLVPSYPLTHDETKELKNVLELVNSSAMMSRSFLENTQLNILKRSDTEADFLFHVVKALDTKYVKPMNRLVKCQKLGVLENLSRQRLTSLLFPNGKPATEITVGLANNTTRTFVGPDADTYDFSGNEIQTLHQVASYMKQSLETISENLNIKLVVDKKQQELGELEKTMVAKANLLNQRADSILPNLDRASAKAIEKIKTTAENLLSEYSETNGEVDKLEKARNLVQCLHAFGRLVIEIGLLPEKAKELEETYKDAVWNPFTATIMDEMVKRRIMAAYKEVLLPYLLEGVDQLDCFNAPDIIRLYKELHQRMLDLREEDTSKLERKLRKERDALVILQLLDLKPLVK